jgi:hypothetical protein
VKILIGLTASAELANVVRCIIPPTNFGGELREEALERSTSRGIAGCYVVIMVAALYPPCFRQPLVDYSP